MSKSTRLTPAEVKSCRDNALRIAPDGPGSVSLRIPAGHDHIVWVGNTKAGCFSNRLVALATARYHLRASYPAVCAVVGPGYTVYHVDIAAQFEIMQAAHEAAVADQLRRRDDDV